MLPQQAWSSIEVKWLREGNRTMDNKELVRLGFEKGCNQHDTEGAAELISEDYILTAG